MTHSEPARPARHPRQNQLLAAAGVLIVAALVLVLVVVLRGGSDAAPSSSADAIIDSFAAALRSHDAGKVAAATCRADRAAVANQTRAVLPVRHGSDPQRICADAGQHRRRSDRGDGAVRLGERDRRGAAVGRRMVRRVLRRGATAHG